MSEIHHRSNTLSVFSHALILLLLTSALGLAGTSMAIGGVPDSSASLSAGSGSGLPGSSVDLTISLASGSANVCTLQFDLGLPSSLTYVSTSTGSAAAAASKSASANPVSGGVRVLVFGLNVNTIGTGPVAVVRVAIASGTPAGPLTVGLSNLAASDPSGNSISITETDGTVTVLTFLRHHAAYHLRRRQFRHHLLGSDHYLDHQRGLRFSDRLRNYVLLWQFHNAQYQPRHCSLADSERAHVRRPLSLPCQVQGCRGQSRFLR